MNFWTQRKVIVTGSGGFVGSRVTAKLKAAGATVLEVRSKAVDLVKQDDAWSMFDAFPAEMVIHLAAVVGGIGANQKSPATFFYRNMQMGLNVIHMAHLAHVQKVVTVGTICAYPKFAPVPFKEADLWQGYPEETNAPYGIAKKSLLVMSQAYRAEHGLNAIYLLPVNLYGPGDNFDPESSHVIPALIRKFHEAKLEKRDEVVCWGTGKATREFLYVDDCAEAIVLAAEKYDKPEPVNIGAGFEISIRELSHMISRFVGFKGKVKWDESKPDGQPRRALDVSRAEREFGWKAKTIFAEGLMKTIEWYVDNRGGNA